MHRLFNTKAIVIANYRINDKNIICKMYTQMFGLQSYIINKHNTLYINMLQPLNILDILVTRKQNSSLQQIKEIKSDILYFNIPYSEQKRAMVLFLSEILYKSIKDADNDPVIFEYIYNGMIHLDKDANDNNFHLKFLMQLTKFLGVFPLNNYSDTYNIFDLQNACFVSRIPNHINYLQAPTSSLISRLISIEGFDTEEPILKNKERKIILATILQYYKIHIMGNTNVKSIEVLEEVLS